jgi:hypothetical protein
VATPEINIDVARKVLKVVDAGLVKGVGVAKPGKMCVEAAVCYALGLPHGDDPECVSRAVRSLKINLNDKNWSSNQARAKGLRRLAIAQLGSRGAINDLEFAKGVADIAIRKCVPAALRSAASIKKNATHKAKLIEVAAKCERDGAVFEAKDAANAANAANAAAYAAYAADAANAAYAADAANAAYAANAANAAAYAADAANAAYAADAANAAYAKKTARDTSLAAFAEDAVQLLIRMNAPGCQWLEITETEAA